MQTKTKKGLLNVCQQSQLVNVSATYEVGQPNCVDEYNNLPDPKSLAKQKTSVRAQHLER